MASVVVAVVATAAAAATSAAVTGIMGAIVGAAVMVGVTALGNAIFGTKAADQTSMATRTPQDIQRTIQSSTEPRKVVYGRSKVGGPLMLAYSTGSKHQYLHLVEALCEGPVDAVESVWFNDTPSTDSRWNEAGGGHRTRTHSGSVTQAADPYLVSEVPGWTSAHRLRGIAYVYSRLHYQPYNPDGDPDQPLGSDVWCNGIPSITAVVKGRKVYDPRDATQNMNNPDTWKWSDNPALCILDYLRAGSPDVNWPLNSAGTHVPPFRGLEAPNEEIDWNNWKAAANICDETVAFSDGTVGRRYTLNGCIYLDAEPSAIVEQMLTACVGNIVYAQGLWRLFPAAMGASDFDLNEDDLRDAVSITPQKSKRDLFNTITGTYVNADAGYIASEFPTVADVGPVDGGDSYETIDGARVEKSITLPFTNDARLAQRIAKLALRKQRICKQVIFPAKLTALPVSCQSVVSLSLDVFGWSNKLFRVVDWSLSDFGVDLTLQEEDAQIYAYTSAEEQAVTSTPVVVPDPWYVEPPENVTFLAGMFALTGSACLDWDVSPDAFVIGYRVQYKEASETTYHLLADRIRSTEYTVTNLGVGEYEFRVQAINTIGATSAWVSASGTIDVPLVMERVSGLELWEGEGLGNQTAFTGNDAKFVWRAASRTQSYEFGEEPYGGDSGALDTYFKDYEVRVVDPATGQVVRTEHPTVNYWEYPYEKNFEDGLRREFTVEVYQRGNQNQLSPTPATLTVSNPAPEELTGLQVDPGFTAIYVSFTTPSDNDFQGIIVWMSDISGFTPAESNKVYDGAGNAVSISGLSEGNTYYLRIAGYDGFGKEGLNVSSEMAVDLGSVHVAWENVTGENRPANNADVTADSQLAEDFDRQNNRNGEFIGQVNITSDGTAIDHTVNTDGSVDISFEWIAYSPLDTDLIDGYFVYVHADTSTTPWTDWYNDQKEFDVYTVPANKTAIILRSVAADLYYTFGIQAYRRVDYDIDASGIIDSGYVNHPSAAGEYPYQPLNHVPFNGMITGTIGNKSTSEIVDNMDMLDDWVAPETLLMNGARIAEATIDSAQIAEAAITNAKIDSLDGSKIHADSVITIGDVENGDYCLITEGEVKIFRRMESAPRQTKELRQWEAGWCTNVDATDPLSAWTELDGYYKTQPQLFLTPKSLQTFKNQTVLADQYLNMDAAVIELIPNHTNRYRFKANARLIASAGTGHVLVGQTTTNTSVTTSYSTPTTTSPGNVIGLYIVVDFSSYHGTGTSGLYYKRKFRWRLYIDTVALDWSGWYSLADLNAIRLTKEVMNLTAGLHTFKIETDVDDAGGTFNTGTVTEYTTQEETPSDIVLFNYDRLNRPNDVPYYTTWAPYLAKIDVTTTITVPSKTLTGWTLDRISMTGNLEWETTSVANDADYIWAFRIYIDNADMFNDTYISVDSENKYNSNSDFSITSITSGNHTLGWSYNYSSHYISSSWKAYLKLKNITYTYHYSRLKPGTTGTENKTILVSYDYTLDGIEELAEGTVNYLALGE